MRKRFKTVINKKNIFSIFLSLLTESECDSSEYEFTSSCDASTKSLNTLSDCFPTSVTFGKKSEKIQKGRKVKF